MPDKRKFHFVMDAWIIAETPGEAWEQLTQQTGKMDLDLEIDQIFGEVINEDQDEIPVSADMV